MSAKNKTSGIPASLVRIDPKPPGPIFTPEQMVELENQLSITPALEQKITEYGKAASKMFGRIAVQDLLQIIDYYEPGLINLENLAACLALQYTKYPGFMITGKKPYTPDYLGPDEPYLYSMSLTNGQEEETRLNLMMSPEVESRPYYIPARKKDFLRWARMDFFEQIPERAAVLNALAKYSDLPARDRAGMLNDLETSCRSEYDLASCINDVLSWAPDHEKASKIMETLLPYFNSLKKWRFHGLSSLEFNAYSGREMSDEVELTCTKEDKIWYGRNPEELFRAVSDLIVKNNLNPKQQENLIQSAIQILRDQNVKNPEKYFTDLLEEKPKTVRQK